MILDRMVECYKSNNIQLNLLIENYCGGFQLTVFVGDINEKDNPAKNYLVQKYYPFDEAKTVVKDFHALKAKLDSKPEVWKQ